MKKIKDINVGVQYLHIFTMTTLLCLVLELLVAMIPQSAIQENMEKSTLFYYEKQGRELLFKDIEGTIIDYYADTILLNVIYGISNDSMLASVITDMYFDGEKTNANIDLMETVYQNKQPNTGYGRYWHGSMVWIRPLLCIMSVAGIYELYAVLIVTGLIGIAFWLLRYKKYKILISFLGAFVISGGIVTAFCFEYGNIVLLMFIMIPLFIQANQKGPKYLYKISIICGVLTCFIDFLSAELLTITVPMLFICLWNINEIKELKDCMKYVKSLFLWGMSYIGMFLIKWILLAFYFGYEGIEENFYRTKDHLQGDLFTALARNVGVLFWGEKCIFSDVKIIVVILIGLFLGVICMWKTKKDNREGQLVLLLLALLPYIRYVCISSHSTVHYFFTYRAQMVTVMVLLFELLNIKDKKQGIR